MNKKKLSLVVVENVEADLAVVRELCRDGRRSPAFVELPVDGDAPRPGGNCIKIGLPGKLGTDPKGKKPLENPPENSPENQLEIPYTGKSPKIGSLDMS